MNEEKECFELNHTSGKIKIPKEYVYEDDYGKKTFDFCESCEKPIRQIDLGNSIYGCEYCKSANQITIHHTEDEETAELFKNDTEKETSKENVLKTALEILKKQREKKEELKKRYDELKERFEQENKELIETIKKNNETTTQTEETVKDIATSIYETSGEKKLFGGVGIRVYKKLDYDQEKALEWAKQHELCLELNKKSFEKIAKTQEISFVKEGKRIVPTIPTKISLQEEGEQDGN